MADKPGEIKDAALRGEGESLVIIDDEQSIIDSLTLILRRAGYSVESANNAREGLAKVQSSGCELVLCDLKMPGMDGLDFLRALKEEGLTTTAIMMSAYATADIAIEAMKLGAYDYIPKPFHAEEILLILRKAIERERLRRENESLRAQITKKYTFSNIIARSDSMRDIFETVKKIADYKTTVMIYGESGTGKELIAQAIHYNSSRRSKKFIAINCGAIPENLLESELFGHKRGAFTDATRDKRGLFEEAEGGTMLLDEIGELPLHLQVKLLRVLQENEIRPVGDSRVIPIDVRIVAATLRDLEKDVLDGRFRDDLYYRLNVVSMHIPPLRERREDIPILVEFFLARNREKLGLAVSGISKEALAILLEHEWKGMSASSRTVSSGR